MRLRTLHALFILVLALGFPALSGKEKKPKPPSPLEEYVAAAKARAGLDLVQQQATGSLFTDTSPFEMLGADLRARRVDDILTIVVAENASAVSRGTTKSSRNSSASASVGKLAGIPSAAGALQNMLSLQGDSKLDGSGATTRQSTIAATVTARVVDVLPNGNLVVEGTKAVMVNSERQMVTIRGVVRPYDLSTRNLIQSDRVAQMELTINGEGVVNDAIRRPNFLYRLLLGLMPF